MFSIVILFFGALAGSLLWTPILRDFARNRGWMDHPDHERKMHANACPRLGGVPIALACLGAFGIFSILPLHWSPDGREARMAAAAAVMFSVGLLDDFFSLKPWQKLTGEIAAAVLMFSSGVQIHTLGPLVVPAMFAAPLTVIWLVGCTNAFNLIDGVDGLAGGLGLIASFVVLAAGVLHHDPLMMATAALLAGALAGFLKFNFNPASIFLGDCGSLLVGFVLASCGVLWSQKASAPLAVTAAPIAFAVPLFDTAISILRRFLRRQPIFSADRDHIHHRLQDRGFTTRGLVWALYSVAVVMAIFSLAESTAGRPTRIVILAAFCMMLFLAIQYLRYREFGLAATALRHNGIRAAVRSHLSLARCEEAVRSATNLDQCWEAVRAAGQDFGFSDVALCVHGRLYRAQRASSQDGHWSIHIPLNGTDYLRFMSPFGSLRTPAIIAPLAEALHRVLAARLLNLAPHPEDVQASAAAFRAKRKVRAKAIAAMAAMAETRETESFVQRKRT